MEQKPFASDEERDQYMVNEKMRQLAEMYQRSDMQNMQNQLGDVAAQKEMLWRQRALENQQAIYRAYIEENRLASTPEKKIKDKVKQALEDMDVYYTMPFTAGYGNSGVPDFLCCIEGKFFGIECKAGKNTTTALQDKHLSDIRAAGGVSLVINEANVDNVKALILANIGASNK